MSLLSVQDLRVAFSRGGVRVEPVRGVSFEIKRGERVALVGESGCGKSLSALSLARLAPTDRAEVKGQLLFEGRDLLAEGTVESVRRSGIAYVFQDPSACLNPVLRVERQLMEVTSRREAAELLAAVGLPDAERMLKSFPCELSGGQQQRVMLAMALAAKPRLLVADEPTTALDVVVQRQVLRLIRELSERFDMAVLLITHNLGIVARDVEQLYVMYAGEIVEEGAVMDVLQRPRHPYTQGLLRAVPSLEGDVPERLQDIPGTVPALGEARVGCGFAPRCSVAKERCFCELPALQDGVRCFL